MSIATDDLTLTWVIPATGGSAITDQDAELYARNAAGTTPWNRIAGAINIADGTTTSNTWSNQSAGHQYRGRVKADNSIGSGQWSSYSNIVTYFLTWVLPGLPTGLVATPGDKQVVLSWTKSTSGSGTVKYDIRYRIDAGSYTQINSGVVGDVDTHTVTGLTNGSLYQFSIRSVNQEPDGTWRTSAWTSVAATRPKVASLKPDKVAGVLIYQYTWAAAIIVYDTPIVPSGAQPVTGVTIEYKLSTDSGWTTKTGNLSGTSQLIPGSGLYTMTQNSTYNFRVKATSSSGDGLWSDTVNLSLVSGRDVPGKPAAPTLTRLTNTSLRVVYTLPADTGGTALYDIDIRYRKLGATRWSSKSTPYPPIPSNHQLNIAGLDSGGTYQVQVKADNGSGSNTASTGVGPWSSSASVVLATIPLKPSPPTAVVSGTSITVSWTIPGNGGSALTGQTLGQSSNGGSTYTYQNVSATATSHTYTNVASGTWVFGVRGNNSVGYGVWSDDSNAVVIQQAVSSTVPLKPATPVFTFDTVHAGWVDLTWVIPNDGGSAITNQDAQYRNRDNSTSRWVESSITNISDGTTTITSWASFTGSSDQRQARYRANNTIGIGPWSDWSNTLTVN